MPWGRPSGNQRGDTAVEVHMWWRQVLAGGAALTFLAAVAAATPAAATSCSPPQLSANPSTVAPGTTTLLSGWGFGTECASSGLGDPATVEVVVRVGEHEKAVGRVEVGADHDFVIDVHLPPSLGTGTGAIIARSEELPAPVVVEISVAGAEGDHGDRPYIVWDQSRGSGIPWGWLGGGAVAGASIALAGVAFARSRSAG